MKASSVIVAPVVPLKDLPSHELDVVRRFLFQHIQGVDETHTRRWRRIWARLVDGEVLQFYPVVDRSLAFHRRHMALEARVFDAQDGFTTRRGFRIWLKTGAALVHLELRDSKVDWMVGSLSYEDLSDDEMREFHEAAIEFLHTPRALKKLWPAVKPAQRAEMVDAVLNRPEEDQSA